MAKAKTNYTKNRDTTAALYERLSRDDGMDSESNSIQTQKILLEQAARQEGYTNFLHYTDDGYSGTSMNRPMLKNMCEDIEKGKISAVFVKDNSRLGRNYLGVGALLEEFFPRYEIRYISVSEGIDSAKGEDELGAFRNIINEQYAKDISRKRKVANKVKGSAGIPLSPPPYGYCMDEDRPKYWKIDEDAARIVRRVFKMAQDGLGTQEIAVKLDNEGVLTPTNYWKSKGMPRGGSLNGKSDTQWNASTIAKMLTSQEYCGDVINFKTYSVSYKDKRRHKNAPENIKTFENVHEAIIDRDIFEKVQEKRGAMRKRKKVDGSRNIFAGLLVCADCGSNMNYHFNQKNPEIEYFNCANNNSGRGDCKGTHNIRLDFLVPVVLEELRRLMQFASKYENEFAAYMSDCALQTSEDNCAVVQREVDALAARDRTLDRLFETLYEDNISGKIGDDRFAKMSQKYELEQAELEEKLSGKHKQLNEMTEKAQTIETFLTAVRRYTRVKKLNARMLNDLIEKIEVHQAVKLDGKWVQKLTIHYRCVGIIDVPNLEKAPFKPFELNTRKGVSVRNASPFEELG